MTHIAPGTELAGYRIVSVIRSGGMGVVYAEHHALKRQMALKVLAPEYSTNDGLSGPLPARVPPRPALVPSYEHVYLADFGLTKLSSSTSPCRRWASSSEPSRTWHPNRSPGTPWTDVPTSIPWPVCSTALLVGHPPFVRDSDIAVMAAHVQAPPPPISRLRPDLPAALGGVFATALGKLPRLRFASASAMAFARPAAC